MSDGFLRLKIACPECDGDGRMRDKTGGGHHGTCPVCSGARAVLIDFRCCGNCGRSGECNLAQSGGRGTGCGGDAWTIAAYAVAS